MDLVLNKEQLEFSKDNNILCLDLQDKIIFEKNISNKKKNIQSAKYYNFNKKKTTQDFKLSEKLYENILRRLSLKLNIYHSLKLKKDDWRILLGPWLKSFIDCTFEKYKIISFIYRKNKKKLKVFIPKSNSYVVPIDLKDFHKIEFFNNKYLYYQLIPFIFHKNQIIKKGQIKNYYPFNENINYLKRYTKKILNFYSNKKTKNLFISTGLGLNNEIKLSLKYNKFSYFSFYKISSISSSSINEEFRYKNLIKTKNNLEEIIYFLVKKNLPKVYLESFKENLQESKKFLPKTIENIFTSTEFITNEQFKIWLMMNRKKINLYTIQHGGTYNTSKFFSFEKIQNKISDKFFVYSKKDMSQSNKITFSHPKFIKKFNFSNYKNDGNIVFILPKIPRDIIHNFSMYSGKRYEYVLNEIKNIIDNLNHDTKKRVKLRIHPYEQGWDTELVLKYFGLGNLIYKSDTDLCDFMGNHSLGIMTYDATAHLELLSYNFPHLMYWNKNFTFHNLKADKFYKEFQKQGLLYTNTAKLSEKLNKFDSNNLEKWWHNKKRQNSINKFCNNYCVSNEELNLEKILKKIL